MSTCSPAYMRLTLGVLKYGVVRLIAQLLYIKEYCAYLVLFLLIRPRKIVDTYLYKMKTPQLHRFSVIPLIEKGQAQNWVIINHRTTRSAEIYHLCRNFILLICVPSSGCLVLNLCERHFSHINKPFTQHLQHISCSAFS